MNTRMIRSFLSNFFHLESDYFTIGGWRNDLRYFLRQQNLLAHIKDRIKFRLYPKLLWVSDFPSHLDVEAASQCQMRCPMCYTTYMPDNLKGVMKWELFTKIIDEAARRGVYSVKLSWRGEPLLNKRLVDMVVYCKEKGIKDVSFLSNGELLTAEMAEKLVDVGLDWISISADGVGKIYNEIRAPAVFEETIARIAHMKAYRDSKNLKKPLIRVQSIMSAVENNPDEFYDAWRGIVDRMNVIADCDRSFEDHVTYEYDPYYKCSKPWERITIAHDGRIHQCNSDYSGKKIIGDCTTQTLQQIWHGPGFTAVREAFRRHKYLNELPACRQCSYGLVRINDKVSVGSTMGVQRYKSVNKVVDADSVQLHTPEEYLTTAVKKARATTAQK